MYITSWSRTQRGAARSVHACFKDLSHPFSHPRPPFRKTTFQLSQGATYWIQWNPSSLFCLRTYLRSIIFIILVATLTQLSRERDEAGGEVDEAGTVEGVEGTDGHRSRFECSHCLRWRWLNWRGEREEGGNGVWNPWNKPAGSECTVLRSQNRNYRVYDVVMVRDLWLEIVAVSLFQATNQSGEFTNFIRVFFIIIDWISFT